MSTQPTHSESRLPQIHPHLCGRGVDQLREACKTQVELETLEQRLLLSGLVVDPQADGRDPTLGLLTTDGATMATASTGLDTGVTDLASLVTALAADFSWNASLPSRAGYMIDPVTGNRTTFSESRDSPIGNDSWYAIYPGRVVWAYDPAATHCVANPTSSSQNSNAWVFNNNSAGPYWWSNTYTDQTEVDKMVQQGVMQLTGTSTVAAAWDALFRAFNKSHGNMDPAHPSLGAPYNGDFVNAYGGTGEILTVKVNMNNCNDTAMTNNWKKVTPQVISAVLDQLVNTCGIAQGNIYVYDDLDTWTRQYWDYYNSSNTADSHLRSPQARFPNVHWKDHIDSGFRTETTRTYVTSTAGIYYPWTLSGQPVYSPIPEYVAKSTYAIDLAVLSAHGQAGVTLCGKNYVGSIGSSPNNGGMNGTVHNHRIPGDLDAALQMGAMPCSVTSFLVNQNLGQKNILYMIDGLYAGWNYGGDNSTPTPWSMPPFGDGLPSGVKGWPSSIFFSQDPVAVDSVGLDFMWNESLTNLHSYNLYANSASKDNIPGSFGYSDAYLHEAAQVGHPASQANYLNPNPSGEDLIPSWILSQGSSASLGIHEHWNNSINKQYSRNQNPSTGQGIELLQVRADLTATTPADVLHANAVSSSRVDLSWNDPSSSETGFRIERSADANFSQISVLADVGANVTTYHDDSVSKQTTYYYRVRTLTAGQEAAAGTPSGPVTTPDDATPGAPAYLAAVPNGATRIDLTWALVDSNDRGIKIERATNTDFTGSTVLATTPVRATSYSDATAVAGTTYYYRVRATNTAGDSPNSNTATAATTTDVTWLLAAGTTAWGTGANWSGSTVPSSVKAVLTGTHGTNQPALFQNTSVLGLDIRSAGWTVNLNGYTLSLGVGGLQLYGGATPTDKIDTGSGNLIVGYTGASPLKMIEGWIKTGGGTKANARDFDWNGTGGITSSAAAASKAHTALGVRDNGFTLANRGPMSPVDGVSVPTNSVVVRYTWYGDMDLDGEVTVNDYLEFLHYYNENPPPEDISWMTGDFNYDGQINVNDYLLLLDGYASQTGPLGGTVETMSSLSQPTAPAETTPTVVQQVAQAGGTHLATTDEAAQTQDDAATADLAVLEQGGQSGQATSVLEVAQTPENPDGLGV